MSAVVEKLHSRIAEVLGRRFVTDDAERLEAYSRDAWSRVFLAAREGCSTPSPDLVAWPADVEQVAAIMGLARQAGCPVVPYGAGSGVCGGTYLLDGGLIIDLKRIDHVGTVDRQDRLVEVGAGALGEHFERRLALQGFTCGHFPSSMYCSTVGGWLAARSAGQMSSRYGKIEDMVSGLTFVDGTARIRRLGARPRAGAGPDLIQTVVGSEGTLGAVTDAVLRVHRAPAVRRMRGVLMPSLESGVEAVRKMFQAGHRPAVVRLYDPLDTLVNKGKGTDTGGGVVSFLRRGLGKALPKSGKGNKRRTRSAIVDAVLTRPRFFGELLDRAAGSCMLVLGSEGQDARLVDYEAREILSISLRLGGLDLGEAPGEHWLSHRYSVSFKLTPALDMGLFVDTLETAATWGRVLGLYHAVRQAVREHGFVMAHFSHAYEEGCSIYFTLAGSAPDLQGSEEAYDRLWRAALDAVVAGGGTISHHHGVGMSKQAFMHKEHGEGGMVLLRALKKALDPDGIMNPGKLGLGGGPELPGAPWRVTRAGSGRGGWKVAA